MAVDECDQLSLSQKLSRSLSPLINCLTLLDHDWLIIENLEFYEKCCLVSGAVEVAEEVRTF